jgi:prepilin-type N-terminal cleavage/methylation domain-containing protein
MHTHRRNSGFTLVEILIVVVILGILAAIVIPQFTNASSEAVKGSLVSQLRTINSQIELYRVRNNGSLPVLPAETNSGWGELVSEMYLKEAPVNGYTGSKALIAGGLQAAMAATNSSPNGWYWSEDDIEVFAAGYDPNNDLLAHEPGFGEDDDDE